MNNALEKRVTELEKMVFVKDDEDKVSAVFRRVVNARKDAPPLEEQMKSPVKGWAWEGHRWLRKPGESDEDFEARVIEGARVLMVDRHPLAVPCFQVMDDENDTE